jgi:hypothetical protein
MALITVLCAKPVNHQIGHRGKSNVTPNTANGFGQGSSWNNNNNVGLSRVARRKRDFQHGFNKK